MTTVLADTARFVSTDPEALVVASFACPCCLCVDTAATGTLDAVDSTLDCACERCDTRWTVGLNGLQSLRLALHPPPPRGDGWSLRLALG